MHRTLTAGEVQAIRADMAAGYWTLAECAEQWGVSKATISRIVAGKQWPAVPPLPRTALHERTTSAPEGLPATGIQIAWTQDLRG